MFPYHYAEIHASAYSIRLVTILPGHPQDTIKATMSHIELPPTPDPAFPSYECLSYAWGDASDRSEIYVGNRVIRVSRNLVESLVHLRHRELPRTMWIDSLCIDQGNMAERSKQVGRMSDIYSSADRVIVWLGPESEDSRLAMDTLIDLSRKIDVHLEDTNKFIPLDGDPETGRWCDYNYRLPFKDTQIKALCNLYNRAWFERLWVWQEIRLGIKRSIIRVGHDSLLWTRFWVISYFLYRKREYALGPAFFTIKNRLETVNDMMNNITQSPMQSLALRTCLSKCSEPRDRVYALMGITTDETMIKADYTLSVGDAYKDLVRQNLRQLGNLEILSVCSYLAKSREEMLTWVPDLRVPNRRKRWFDLDGAGEPPASATYVPPGTLETTGTRVDTVTSVHALPNSGTDNEIIDHLRRLAPVSLASQPYIAGGNTLDAYCRSFFANEFLDRYQPAGDFLLFNFMNFTQALGFFIADDPKSDPEALAFFVNTFTIQTAGRSLFTTRSGYVGLASDQAQLGDEVIHILGCRWPMLLRPVTEEGGESQYMVVGFVYVDGGNDREAILGPLPKEYTHVALWEGNGGLHTCTRRLRSYRYRIRG